MKKFELVFIPSPGRSHLVATVETAKLLLDRDDRLIITVLIMKLPQDRLVDAYTQKITSNPNTSPRLQFINLPSHDETSNYKTIAFGLIENHTTHVRDIISNRVRQQTGDYPLAGLVLDMFCTNFIEVAEEFGLPAYVLITSSTSGFRLFQYLDALKFEHNQDLTQYKNSDVLLSAPCFSTPVPAKVVPSMLLEDNPMSEVFMNRMRRVAETRGIMVNTFYGFESRAVESLSSNRKNPRVYPVGPILGGDSGSEIADEELKKWLDDQPENSVVFLCFGTMGTFEEPQVREIATALENSGSRFLWSLRKRGEKGTIHSVAEHGNVENVLPEGFLERTKDRGKVIGWAQQAAVLAHAAVGGFVSHCGWSSTLESVWYGVPIATFPLFAEQQLNAFLLVKEQGMAEEIRIDYKMDFFKGGSPPEIVAAEEIEAAIRRLMAEGSGVRVKVMEMQSKARLACLEGGSSYKAQCDFIEDVIRNIA